MNALVKQFNTQPQAMSHREIASLTGKEARNVKRDCDAMFKELELDALSFEHIYFDGINRRQTEYMLPRDLVETLITGYSIKLRHAVLQRLRELEAFIAQPVPTLPDFTNPAAAARAWAQEFEAKQIAEQKVAVLAPKAEALDTIADTTNTYTIRECAKSIGVQEKVLINLLIERRWIYRDESKRLQPYADKVVKNIFINRTSPVIVGRNDGQERVFLHMRVTAFGLTRIAGLANKVLGVGVVA